MTDEHRPEWLSAWREADFSWEGLAERQWRGWAVRKAGGVPYRRTTLGLARGSRHATLQDFWRAERDHLISDPADGRLWTRIHAPMRWSNGAPSKVGWKAGDFVEAAKAIDRAIELLPDEALARIDPPSKRMRTSSEVRRSQLSRYATSWGLPLDGIVLRAPPAIVFKFPYVAFRAAMFTGPVKFPASAKLIDFRQCLFQQAVILDGDRAEVSFRGCLFAGEVLMRNLNTEAFSAFGSRFLSALDANDLTVESRVDLRNVVCHADAAFDSVKAAVGRLNGAKFLCAVDFENAVLQRADFLEVEFCNSISLQFSRFDIANFGGAKFGRDADFSGVIVAETAKFRGAEWSADANFEGAELTQAEFASATFRRTANFIVSTFSGSTDFNGAAFEGTAIFADVTWPPDIADYERAFWEARFERFANFDNQSMIPFAAFDGATISKEIRLNVAALAHRSFRKIVNSSKREGRLESLEHGLRTLRNSAESVRNRSVEHCLHRFELLARRAQARPHSGERVLSWIYDQVSYYGGSLSRPIIALIGLWVLGAFFYLGLAIATGDAVVAGMGWGWHVHPAAFAALDLSARSLFNLFGIWGVRPTADLTNTTLVLEHALLWQNSMLALSTRLISTAQSAASGVLLFLIALAAKRRFQIT